MAARPKNPDLVVRGKGRPRAAVDLATSTANPRSKKGRKVYCFQCRYCSGGWCTVKAAPIAQRTLACAYGVKLIQSARRASTHA